MEVTCSDLNAINQGSKGVTCTEGTIFGFLKEPSCGTLGLLKKFKIPHLQRYRVQGKPDLPALFVFRICWMFIPSCVKSILTQIFSNSTVPIFIPSCIKFILTQIFSTVPIFSYFFMEMRT